ncbi:MAG: threonine--tRNA ligase [Patescibacteria group bacterium]|nr:threonine--tRNA ligase [Patescibacteria group bacterium]
MSNPSDNKNQSQKNNLDELRHSTAHLLAKAVIELYPGAKPTIGPSIEQGFYYDFDLGDTVISDKNFAQIEQKMHQIVKKWSEFRQVTKTQDEALAQYTDNQYKRELIGELAEKGETLSFYEVGTEGQPEFYSDLCKGPHVAKPSEVLKHFKLLSVAGAYWRGDEKNSMLTRIYGTAFFSQQELDDHLKMLEQAKLRDHRKIGQELELFMIDEEVGQGLPLWLPKGAFLRHKVQEYAFNTYLNRGYQPVSTPHIASKELWEHSGHLDFYSDSMYGGFGIEDEEYRLKPMNCPLHVKLFMHRQRSYRELPIRWTEMGTVYRYEKSGVLHGLSRVRGFTQDDAHIICTPDQLQAELTEALNLTLDILKTFGFKDFEMNLSTGGGKDESKFIGEKAKWREAEQALTQTLTKLGFDNFVTDEGGAAFYGPKIDLKLADSLGRMWQLSTIQLDFNLPGRFGMKYVGDDGAQHEPFMIHRALLGSLERFLGIYIEHTGGKFPLWLAPVQAVVLPITDAQNEYARRVTDQLTKAGLRVEVDDRSERLQAKIRDAQLQKVPFMLVVGGKEVESKSVAVRGRETGDEGRVQVEEFIKKIQKQVIDKS